MRLTLRTLLAYLDDTLEPAEIKQIGLKVAESEPAQELVARIKQVTRKRRLTTPPLTGPGAKFDSNVVAEYLDNELSGEQVAEVEKICLESDVHLAEIAACHQILTLVLGEPALVPPTARERMYGLVKGREAIPFRKAAAKDAPGHAAAHDGEEDVTLLGMPFGGHQARWLRWALPLAAVLLLAALAGALWGVFRNANPNPVVASNDKAGPGTEGVRDPNKEGKEPNKEGKEPNKEGDGKPPKKENDPPRTVVDPPKKENDPPLAKNPERPAEPSKERREAGTYQGAPEFVGLRLPSVLVQRKRDEEGWTRLTPNSPVHTSDSLVSLPGYPSDVRTSGGVLLQLWGTMPEFTQHEPILVALEALPRFKLWGVTPEFVLPPLPQNPFVYESAVVLHANPDFDLELTLERGRIYLANRKADDKPARVRLRFYKEIWDLTLERDAEVAVDLFAQYHGGINYLDGEEPYAEADLCVLRGKAVLKVDQYHEFPNLEGPAGPALFTWNNKGPASTTPVRLDHAPPVVNKEIPATAAAKDMRLAMDEISSRMASKQKVDVTLLESVKKGLTPSHRTLAIYCLGAIDAVANLLDILGDEDPTRGPERVTAMLILRRWISRGADTGRQLYDLKTRNTGILIRKNYQPYEAEIILRLLHDFNDVERRQRETFELLAAYLRSNRMSIRVLAYWQLLRNSAGARNLPPYDPAWPADKRDKAAGEWQALISKGELPPPLPTAPPMPPK